ncbi:MAG: hypothetical protein IPN65_00125 [Elusimicrobia bacterium]|nr:hypothetical protein [Elusimicrobiota bacterium]MBK9057347.1 hypothetical protein [Elusimicrobiota bacterium]MBK9428920.1 hypothetical protein [Elusimicrobiota bacterium]MBL0360115.1 hypothetical protein [Elusimicrobiota bacterium]
MMAIYDELEPYGQAQREREIVSAILAKYGNAMLEVIRLTGENVRLNKQVTELQGEVKRQRTVLDYLLDEQAHGR